MWNQKPCFRFEIDNFSEKKDAIASDTFVSGGYEWYLYLPQKADNLYKDHRFSLFLSAANLKPLQTGWKRSANFYFSVLNQSDKELYRSPIGQARYPFCSQVPTWGFRTTLPLSKLQERGFLEKDRLIIEVYIKLVEAVEGEGLGVSVKKEAVDVVGSQDYAFKVALVRKIFAEHPEIAEEFKPKNQVVKTEYKNILQTACSKVSEIAEVGLKMDWLKSKLSEFSSESKKADDELGKVLLKNKKPDDADGPRVQHLEERVKNLELMESSFKMEYCLKSKQLEERIKNLELMESSFKMDYCLKSKQLEERVMSLELMENGLRLDSLKSKVEEVSLEKKKSDADRSSHVQQLEDRVKNLEMMVSELKVELDKEKARSSADGFLLVDEVDSLA